MIYSKKTILAIAAMVGLGLACTPSEPEVEETVSQKITASVADNGSSAKWEAAAVQLQQEMYLRDRVLAAMNAGEILKQQLSMKRHNGYYQLQAVVECREMISKTVEAKWNKEDFADD